MLFGTWSQAHAYDPSDYMETRLKEAVIPAQNLTECFPRLQRRKPRFEMSNENK